MRTCPRVAQRLPKSCACSAQSYGDLPKSRTCSAQSYEDLPKICIYSAQSYENLPKSRPRIAQ